MNPAIEALFIAAWQDEARSISVRTDDVKAVLALHNEMLDALRAADDAPIPLRIRAVVRAAIAKAEGRS